MKKKDYDELKVKNQQQLKKAVWDMEKEKANLQMDRHLGKLKNLHVVNTKKKDIARVLTLLVQKKFQDKTTKETNGGAN